MLKIFARPPIIRYPTYDSSVNKAVKSFKDSSRYATIGLALTRIDQEHITGAIAELGVWRGHTSAFMRRSSPSRAMYLFDTFEGFPSEQLTDIVHANDGERFSDTSVGRVRKAIGDCSNVVFRPGKVPDTLVGLESETFAFVLLDLDIYLPTVAALEFFYPRMPRGAYLMVHDYNSPESNYAMRRAIDPFLHDKPELLIELPDEWGSAMFRKL